MENYHFEQSHQFLICVFEYAFDTFQIVILTYLKSIINIPINFWKLKSTWIHLIKFIRIPLTIHNLSINMNVILSKFSKLYTNFGCKIHSDLPSLIFLIFVKFQLIYSLLIHNFCLPDKLSLILAHLTNLCQKLLESEK